MQKIQVIIAEVLLCAIFWMYISKNMLFMLPLFKEQKSHKFSNFSYPGSRKVLISAKIMISGQKCCCFLMQDSLKYLCAQFGYKWTKNKEMVKPNPGMVKSMSWLFVSNAFWGSIKTMPVTKPSSKPCKILSFRKERHVSIEWFFLKPDW